MENRCIPANLHYTSPNQDIPGLADGRLKVVAQNTKWNGGFVGINSFGFGGSNVHALIRSNEQERRGYHPACKQTRLLTCNGRTEESVEHVIEKAIENKENVEMQALIQEVAAISPGVMPCRGYAVLNSENKVTEVQVSLKYHSKRSSTLFYLVSCMQEYNYKLFDCSNARVRTAQCGLCLLEWEHSGMVWEGT